MSQARSSAEKSVRLVMVFTLLILSIGAFLSGISVAEAQGTAIEVGDATLSVGESASVDIWVRNFPDDGYGLGCYAIRIDYDPTTIGITGVSPGAPPFNAPISNTFADYVSITQFTVAMPGPNGDIRIAALEFTCLGPGETTLTPIIEVLANTDGVETQATPVNGTVTQIPLTTPQLTPTPPPTVATTPCPTLPAGGGSLPPSPTHTITPTPSPALTPTHTPEPTPAPTQTPASSELQFRDNIDESGVVQQVMELTFADGAGKIEIPEGTIALTTESSPLEAIQWQPVDKPPLPPPGYHIVGPAYDLRPEEATFAPPLSLTFQYDPVLLPDGLIEEGLSIAYFDVEMNEWVDLDSTVDSASHSVTAYVSHFTLFAILSKAPPPPFSLNSLTVSPSEVTTSEFVTVLVEVTNNGTVDGDYAAVLIINGAMEETTEITLAGGATTTVAFTISKDKPGSYEVEIDGQRGEFTVSAPSPAATNWSLIGGIIAAVMLLGLASLFFLTRRSTSPAG